MIAVLGRWHDRFVARFGRSDSVSMPSALPTRKDVDRGLGYVIALGGAALGVIAAWLPLRDPDSYRRAHPGEPVNDELLVQAGPGLLLVVAAMACVASVALAFRGRRTTRGPTIAGILAILATLAGLRFLFEAHFGASHGTPGPGPGVYAGLGAGLLMVVGGLLIRSSFSARTLVVASAASVLLALWLLTGLGEPASPEGVATPSGFYVWPAYDTDPQEHFNVASQTCAAQSVRALARVFDDVHGWHVQATPEAVAGAYARVSPEPAHVYNGCLAGVEQRR